MAGRGSRGRARYRPLKVGVGAVVCLLLLEGVARMVMGNFGQSLLLQRSDDPAICLELRPGADVPYTGWLMKVPATRMRVNALGGRGPEIPPKGDRLRIATFGDSFTFGQGVEEDASWPAAMGAAMTGAGTPTEVLNFGVPGHGTPQAVALAKAVVPTVDADVALVAVFTNDLSPQDSYCGYGEGDSGLERWVLQNVYLGRLAWILGGPLRGGPTIPDGLGTPEERFREALTDLSAFGRAHDVRTYAVLLSDRDAYAAARWCDGCTPPHELMQGIPLDVLDVSGMWPVLVDHRERYFLKGEEHLTVAGNRVIGEAVAEALLDVK